MVLVCVAWSSPARAEIPDRGGIVVLPFRSAPPGAAAVTGTLPDPVLPFLRDAMLKGTREAMRAKVVNSAQQVVDAEETSVRLARATYDPQAEERRTRVRLRIEEAYSEFFALDLAAATRSVAEASGAMERSPQTAADLKILSDIKLLDGIIALSSDPRSADQAFDLVLRLAPERTLDRNRFPPYAVNALKAAKERFDQLPTTQVNVESDPADASISIDGVPYGRTPRTVDRIATGEHFYRLEKAHMKPLFGRIVFRGGVIEPLSLHLEPVQFLALQQRLIDEQHEHSGSPGAALARLFAADRVVLATVAPDGPRRYSVAMWWADEEGHCSWPLRRNLSAELPALAASVASMTREVLATPSGEAREPATDPNALARDAALLAAGTITGAPKPPPPVWYKRKSVMWGTAGGALLGLLIFAGYQGARPGKVNYDVTLEPNQ